MSASETVKAIDHQDGRLTRAMEEPKHHGAKAEDETTERAGHHHHHGLSMLHVAVGIGALVALYYIMK